MALLRSNIIQNNTQGGKSGWCTNPFSPQPGFFTAIKSGLSLNAMPTPFARAEVIKQAFNALSSSNINVSDISGNGTYQQLVSDTIDILEILYNYESYKDIIKIIPCRISAVDFPKCNELIDRSGNKSNVSYIQDAISQYKSTDDVYLVVYDDGKKNCVLAMSNLDTLFFTTARLDTNVNTSQNEYDLVIDRRDNSSKTFFRTPRSIGERDSHFQDYLYHLFISNKDSIGNTAIGKYLSQVFGSSRNDNFVVESVVPLRDKNGNQVNIDLGNGQKLSLYRNNIPQANELINNTLINIGYKINSERFETIKGDNNYLLPINMQALSRVLDPDALASNFSKGEYEINTFDSDNNEYKVVLGESLENEEEDMVPFDLGIYPFFKYPKNYIKERHTTYNVILASQLYGSFGSDAIDLIFYRKKGESIEKINTYSRDEYNNPQNGLDFGVVKEVRTKIGIGDKKVYTTHYTLVGTNFDYIEVRFNLKDIKNSGVLKPKFDKIQTNDKEIMFAVDFGTTSTYIASRIQDNVPKSFTTNEESMVFLHKNHKEDNKSRIYKYESYLLEGDSTKIEKEIPELVRYIKNEFVPSSIDNEFYKFPLRTAISCTEGNESDMFSNANIAFTYDKEPATGNNKYLTNLKWDSDTNDYVNLYINEIVRLCSLYAMASGCNIENVSFQYFYPLAMGQENIDNINEIWKKSCKKYGISDTNIIGMTESLAPYYCTKKNDTSCVVSIDIGGGSVDSVIFKDSKVQFALSSLFGCDVLWSGGQNLNSNDKSNPIYNHVKKTMDSNLSGCKIGNNDALKKIQDEILMESSDSSSISIMNFWIYNDNIFGITKELKNKKKYAAAYVGHFYSILYNLAQAMRLKKVSIPTEITLSGNGSLYLSYIKSDLELIAKEVFSLVNNGEKIDSIKITLPEDNNIGGKEMTALGGLNYNEDKGKTIIDDMKSIYLGTTMEQAESFDITKKDSQLINAENSELDNSLVESICNNVINMQKGLAKVFKDLNIDQDDSFVYKFNECRTQLLELLKDKNLGPLHINNKRIKNSLFFIPLRQMIFKLEETGIKKQ